MKIRGIAVLLIITIIIVSVFCSCKSNKNNSSDLQSSNGAITESSNIISSHSEGVGSTASIPSQISESGNGNTSNKNNSSSNNLNKNNSTGNNSTGSTQDNNNKDTDGTTQNNSTKYVNKQTDPYAIKMDRYMISKGYRNQMSTPNENVTKLDLVGVCEALHCNFISFNYEYDIQQYMQIYGFDVAKKDENVSYIEMVLALTDSFSSYDGINENATLNMSTEQLNGFDDRQKKLLKIAVNLGIMENNASSLQNKTISKNGLNVVAVNLAEKYATICPSVQQYNDDTWSTTLLPAKLITNGSELPKNHDRYPYIINTIPKEVYEYSFIGDGYSDFSEPILCYDGLYSVMSQAKADAETHLKLLLNIDYRTINAADLEREHEKFFSHSINTLGEAYGVNYYEDYVKYVKENEIIIKGQANVLLPIIYTYDGLAYVRTFVEFDIMSSKTKEDLFFYDRGMTYDGTSFSFYVDFPLTGTVNSVSLRTASTSSLFSQVLSKDSGIKFNPNS